MDTQTGAVDYVVYAVDPSGIDQMWPLVQMIDGEFSAASWRDFALEHTDGRRPLAGIMVLKDRDGYMHGMFCWKVQGRHLSVCRFCSAGLFDQERVIGEIMHAIHELALRHHCSMILLRLSARMAQLPQMQTALVGWHQDRKAHVASLQITPVTGAPGTNYPGHGMFRR